MVMVVFDFWYIYILKTDVLTLRNLRTVLGGDLSASSKARWEFRGEICLPRIIILYGRNRSLSG